MKGVTVTTDNIDLQDAIEYEIYVNDVISPLPVSAGIDFDFVYGTNHGENVFTIKARRQVGQHFGGQRSDQIISLAVLESAALVDR